MSTPTPYPSSASAIQGVPIDVPAGAGYVATYNSGTGIIVWAPTQAVGVQDVSADPPLSAGSDAAHPEISIASPIPVTLGGTSIDTSGLTGRPKLAAGVPSVAAINLATEVTGTLPSANGGTAQDWSSASGRPKVTTGVFSLAAIGLTTEVTGTLPVGNGGTGGTTPATALAALGIRAGTLTLASGTATVTDAATTANTRVVVTPTAINAGAGSLTVQYSHVSNSAGASFVVRANIAAGTINTLDTSVLDYIAIG